MPLHITLPQKGCSPGQGHCRKGISWSGPIIRLLLLLPLFLEGLDPPPSGSANLVCPYATNRSLANMLIQEKYRMCSLHCRELSKSCRSARVQPCTVVTYWSINNHACRSPLACVKGAVDMETQPFYIVNIALDHICCAYCRYPCAFNARLSSNSPLRQVVIPGIASTLASPPASRAPARPVP